MDCKNMDFKDWYAVFVMTGTEDEVKRRIEGEVAKHKGVSASAFVPKVLHYEIHPHGRVSVLKVMFPGYVLVGTDDIAAISGIVSECKDVIRFLRNGEHKIERMKLSEIARLVYMADDDGIIGESEVELDANSRIVVLSGPLKGMDGYITKYNHRRGRVTVSFLIGTERKDLTLSVKLVQEDTRTDAEYLWGAENANSYA